MTVCITCTRDARRPTYGTVVRVVHIRNMRKAQGFTCISGAEQMVRLKFNLGNLQLEAGIAEAGIMMIAWICLVLYAF